MSGELAVHEICLTQPQIGEFSTQMFLISREQWGGTLFCRNIKISKCFKRFGSKKHRTNHLQVLPVMLFLYKWIPIIPFLNKKHPVIIDGGLRSVSDATVWTPDSAVLFFQIPRQLKCKLIREHDSFEGSRIMFRDSPRLTRKIAFIHFMLFRKRRWHL